MKTAEIHTSDRIAFKRCRRKWGWSSPLRQNLELSTPPGPLWMGSGFHFAMEDFHGLRKYSNAQEAFRAYLLATRKSGKNRLPDDHLELTELCLGMLSYYERWLESRDKLKTFVYKGVPQVEVRFEIPLPIENATAPDGKPYDEVSYTGTIDRVVIDEDDRLWPLDYKTAKAFSVTHFETDPQITAYCWAASVLYPGYQVAGFIYQQHLKAVPEKPQVLKNGRLSLNKNQFTSHRLYREALINLYGTVDNAPTENVNFLNELAQQESPDEDRYIRRDWVERSREQLESEGEKILMEVVDMLDSELPLYPNPTRDCVWDCAFTGPCLLFDCHDDFEYELKATTVPRSKTDDSWRKYLKS